MALFDKLRKVIGAVAAPTPPATSDSGARYPEPPTPRSARPSPPAVRLAAPPLLRDSYTRFPNLPGSDRQLLARFGADVSARLEAALSAQRVTAMDLDIFRIREFMTAEECAAMIELIDADVKASTVLSAAGNSEVRTSETCRLSAAHHLVAEVERRMSEALGLPLTHSETIQGQRYRPGQQFKMHNDYFAGGQSYSDTVAKEGGQRTWTAMVFLNRPERGGATNFPRALVKVQPELGTLLTWNNNDDEGLSNPFTDHEGMVVEAGVKYILTKWFREREWHSSADSDALRV